MAKDLNYIRKHSWSQASLYVDKRDNLFQWIFWRHGGWREICHIFIIWEVIFPDSCHLPFSNKISVICLIDVEIVLFGKSLFWNRKHMNYKKEKCFRNIAQMLPLTEEFSLVSWATVLRASNNNKAVIGIHFHLNK